MKQKTIIISVAIALLTLVAGANIYINSKVNNAEAFLSQVEGIAQSEVGEKEIDKAENEGMFICTIYVYRVKNDQYDSWNYVLSSKSQNSVPDSFEFVDASNGHKIECVESVSQTCYSTPCTALADAANKYL